MAIASPKPNNFGQPTSWSAAIDALAAGRQIDISSQGAVYLDKPGGSTRLFIVCAGNVHHSPPVHRDNYLERCDIEPILDPGQSWNALTVGAITMLDSLPPEWPADIWQTMAPKGELSPHSTTSLVFGDSWPIKPDVVFEGGNLATDNSGSPDYGVPSLCLLTTRHDFNRATFCLTACTSAATSLASHFAAQIMAEYPSFCDETVRGMIVHSARWTPAMMKHFSSTRKKAERLALVRRYGFGLPDLERALRSATNSLTLVAERQITPFREGNMGDIHLFQLPWPADELTKLGDAEVELRVTLSYFIEPNPARRGWNGRYRYASHGLEFDLKRPLEKEENFRRRINKKNLQKGESRPAAERDDRWMLGPNARSNGSIHCDIWIGTAAALAEKGVIAVYPTGGWWKELSANEKPPREARYSLLISIDSPSVDVDIYTPVEQKIMVKVET
jgi:hypothetical protein